MSDEEYQFESKGGYLVIRNRPFKCHLRKMTRTQAYGCGITTTMHESMFSMFGRINAKEHVVGWYNTEPKLRENDLDPQII
ncbi:hypothetical protein RND81_07G139000 [Saponaria officinalis]|uniref:JAB1/MPN/MOV34 metalloenzyme domain-containing protein n=1 Tax=Saponaria officinalis TaxID=3572 RepID=A0AAW1JN69_SAPOF